MVYAGAAISFHDRGGGGGGQNARDEEAVA